MKNTGIRYGVVTGLAVVVYLMGFYFVEKSLFRGLLATWSSLVIYILGMFMATSVIVKEADGELSLQQSIQTPFVVFLIANAFYCLLFYFLVGVFDEELLKIHQELTHEGMLDFYKNTEQLHEVKKMNPEDFTPTPGGTVIQYIKGIIGGFLLSLLIGLAARRL